MNAVPLYVAYNRHSKFLGVRVDIKVGGADMSTPTFTLNNGHIFTYRRDVQPDNILDVIYDMVDAIPILKSVVPA